jgi:Fur family ferric uptake transcriptional regulator
MTKKKLPNPRVSTSHQPRPKIDALAVLREAGLRVTGVRRAVIDVLSSAGEALDAAGVLARIPAGTSADRVTVYRTLSALVEAGVAHRVEAGDRVYRYSLTDHARCTPERHVHEHPHLVCDRCGSVQCLEDTEVIIQARSGSLAARRGIARLSRQSITLHGLCERCDDRAE